ncbi:TKL protein kinase [Phytophthora nicotianae P10297]|nr:TKL protein kinase [Phytophthora nicotianae P10297]KUF85804.1 serine/threonine-protein kinase [Phytophthora nicotianae]
MYSISASYLGDQCGGTPYAINIFRDNNCSIETCSPSSNTSSADMRTVDCASDYIQAARDKFGSSPYIIELVFRDENCSDFGMGYGYPASGTCVGGYTANDSYYVIASLNKDGSASLELYPDRSCLSESLYSVESGDKEAVQTHECDANWFKWYSSNDAADTSGSTLTSGSVSGDSSSAALSNGDILGIILGSFVFLMVFLVAVFLRLRQKLKSNASTIDSLSATSAASIEAAIRGQTGLWNDDIITTKRIPRDKVQTEKLISRGSFGEVYAGIFNGQQVAVKMLLSASRDNITLVNEFLAEAKMTATMDHPHIVSFVGVAWDSLTDLCVVLEYMDGGELRSLLNSYLESKNPVGFDREKATIALQVCHALTYLHSLMPSIIHRDLKSRNILLDKNMQAKLSDFGISRERLDRTMTAGVGTSLWMAPEVMLGEHYDDKADMFSFGVVLSELDMHTLPYARAKKENLDSNGREMIDSILLQKVALGKLQVEFSNPKPRSIGELGRACISIDPTERPSAAEALYRLQVILSKRRIV